MNDEFLEFPVEPDFVSKHVTLSLNEVIKWCEKELPRVISQPGFKAQWLRDKVDVPFEM
jgi:hypothetical protein